MVLAFWDTILALYHVTGMNGLCGHLLRPYGAIGTLKALGERSENCQ
jgi:hypothetical protein